MDKILAGLIETFICWTVFPFIGIVLVDSIMPTSGPYTLTLIDWMVFVAISWVVVYCIHGEQECQTSFNVWMILFFVSALFSI